MVSVKKSKKDGAYYSKKTKPNLKGGIKKKKQSIAMKGVVKSLEKKGSKIFKTDNVELNKPVSSRPKQNVAVDNIVPIPQSLSSPAPDSTLIEARQKMVGRVASNKKGVIKNVVSKYEDSEGQKQSIKRTRHSAKRDVGKRSHSNAIKKTLTNKKKRLLKNTRKRSKVNKLKKLKEKKLKLEKLKSDELKLEESKLEELKSVELKLEESKLEELKLNKQLEIDKANEIAKEMFEVYHQKPESSTGILIQAALKLANTGKAMSNNNNGTENEDSVSNLNSKEHTDDQGINGWKNLITKVVGEYFVSQSGEKPDLPILLKNVIKFQEENASKTAEEVKGLCCLQVKRALDAVIEMLRNENSESKVSENLLFDESPNIYLQIACMKIPKTPTREIRVLLPHCPLSDPQDVCIFVQDLKRGRRVEVEPTIQHFKDILEKNKIKNISEIVPFNQLRTDYEQYEMKRALCARFDCFLVDSSICQHVFHVLGKSFIHRRKIPIPVDLKRKDLRETIDKALRKTSFRMSPFSSTFSAKIGHSKMTLKQLYDNVLAFCSKLPEIFPGGWQNISSLILKGPKTTAVPFYLSKVRHNNVPVPRVKAIRPKACVEVEDELDPLGRVVVSPWGDVRTIDEGGESSSDELPAPKKTKNMRKWEKKRQKLSLQAEPDHDDDEEIDEGVSAFQHKLLQQARSAHHEKKNQAQSIHRDGDNEEDKDAENPGVTKRHRTNHPQMNSPNEENVSSDESKKDGSKPACEKKTNISSLERTYLMERLLEAEEDESKTSHMKKSLKKRFKKKGLTKTEGEKKQPKKLITKKLKTMGEESETSLAEKPLKKRNQKLGKITEKGKQINKNLPGKMGKQQQKKKMK